MNVRGETRLACLAVLSTSKTSWTDIEWDTRVEGRNLYEEKRGKIFFINFDSFARSLLVGYSRKVSLVGTQTDPLFRAWKIRLDYQPLFVKSAPPFPTANNNNNKSNLILKNREDRGSTGNRAQVKMHFRKVSKMLKVWKITSHLCFISDLIV